MEPTKQHLEVLKKYFGHKEFRPMQWKIISSIINDKRDNCVIMATGYGKSLCFQYPPVFCKGLALVISPLISLMQDQVLALTMRGIPATYLGSAQASKDVLYKMKNGEYNVVYLTPEWCSNDFGATILDELSESGVKITLIAIDEAHCVSQWGMDFRSSYRKLGKLRNILPNTPLLTLTATATEIVRKDICLSLKLRNPQIITTSCDRPNLYLSASIKGKDLLSDIRSFMLKMSIHVNKKNMSTIIYCPTKKSADKIAAILNDAGIRCSLYHADISIKARERVHKEFVTDEINVIVATVAFGMGIDKPDVRAIIHYGAPKDIESYYQEIGRAGRDGLPSKCHVFYAQTDFQLAKHFYSHLNGKFRYHKELMAKVMENYLQTSNCRRQLLVSHFDPKAKLEPNENCCDNCTNKKSRPHQNELDFDLTEDALLLLRAVKELGGFYGLAMAIFLLKGSTNKRLPAKYYSSELYRAGHYRSDEWWKLLGGLLIREDLIEETFPNIGGGWNKNNFPVKTLKVSSKGKQYMLDKKWRDLIELKPTQEMIPFIKKFLPKRNPDDWISSNTSLETSEVDSSKLRQPALEEVIFDDLTTFRSKAANELNCMPYMIFNNRTMQDLAQKMPKNKEELSSIEGINEKIVDSHGQACIDCIAASIEKYKTKKPSALRKDLKRFVHNSKQRILRYENDQSSQDENNKFETDSDASTFYSCEQSEHNSVIDENEMFHNSGPSEEFESLPNHSSEAQANNSKAVSSESNQFNESFFNEEENDIFISIDENELLKQHSKSEESVDKFNNSLIDNKSDDDEQFIPPLKRVRVDISPKKIFSLVSPKPVPVDNFKAKEQILIANNEKKKSIIKKKIKL